MVPSFIQFLVFKCLILSWKSVGGNSFKFVQNKQENMASESSNQRDSCSRHDLCGNSGGESISDMSSFEMDRTIAGGFDGHLYHVLPAGMKVNIQFILPVLFKDFMGLLENEFDKSSRALNDRFSVTSHIQGRSVTITVIEDRKTIEVSGPGHKLWKEITFKRIVNTLFTRFIHNFSIDLQSSINTANVQPQMTSALMKILSCDTMVKTKFICQNQESEDCLTAMKSQRSTSS